MADLVAGCLLHDNCEGQGAAAINAEPSVAAHMARVTELPDIKKWIENRPKTEF